MSSDFESWRKILKDETNRQLLLLLNEKGALTSEELTDALNVTPGLLGHHLKVLNDLVKKTVDDKYVLSEKGKQVHALLNDLPTSAGVSRRWKITWFISIVINIVIASILGYISNSPRPIFILMLLVLSGLILSYALKVKPKSTGRILYITLGAAFIGLSWLFIMKIVRDEYYFARFPPGSTGDNIISILIIVACYVIGGLVGEWIGRKMQYKLPLLVPF
ncbi:MAG: ArsR family transcriptional regulator [Candidatus Bathyarchaeota archaeon]|nr:ArsR family transcriptional regulator [Candidatus Termiticorpusculum sp.]